MATVEDILVAAYLRSSQNDPGKLAQDSELIGHLNRVYQRTWMLLARARPDQFAVAESLTFAGVPPSATLPSGLIDILAVVDAADQSPVYVIPRDETLRRWHIAPRATRSGFTLYSVGRTGDPIAGDIVTLIYLGAPDALTALVDVIDARWPSRHEQLLVDYVATYLGVKDAGRSTADRAALLDELRQSVAAMVSEYELMPSAMGWIHADAERAVS